MLGFETIIQSPVLEYRKNIDLKEDIRKHLEYTMQKTGYKLKDLKIQTENLLLSDGLITVYDVRYTFYNPYYDTTHSYHVYLPQFLNDYYIILNGMRYAFIYSFVDKPLTRFGSDSSSVKLSNMYVKFEFRNVFDETKQLQVRFKKFTIPLLNFVLGYYYVNNAFETYTDLFKYVLDKMRVKYSLNHFAANNEKQNNIKIQKEDQTIKILIPQENTEIIVTEFTPLQGRLLTSFKYYKVPGILQSIFAKKTPLQARKLFANFESVFDYQTLQDLEINSSEEFIEQYILNDKMYYATKDLYMFTNLRTKRVALKIFLLHPLIRQLSMILQYWYIDKGSRLPKKHTVTLAILYKIMQIELAEGKLHNPISEVALNCKVTYMNKFAIKRRSASTRLIPSDMLGIICPISTPETQKVGAVNWLVLVPNIKFDK
jgi:RNA polymerase Rpb2, domain 3.